MSIEEQFNRIIVKTQEQQLITFLKALTPDQKKSLTPSLKKLSKEYSEYGNLGNSRWGYIKGSDKQREMLQQSSFVCFNRADYERSPSPVWFLDKDKLKDIIGWYVPGWFSDYVNKTAGLEYFTLEYDWIMYLTNIGALQPTKELLVKAMPRMIFEHNGNQWNYKPENLLKSPITLEEHLWYLFEYQTDLHYSDRFIFFGKNVSKEKIGWMHLFKKFAAEGKIDRQRLLKESLLASNRNFNKVLSGWFIGLFAGLEPSNNELLSLQKDIFSVLNAPHSKPVGTALNFIKKIVPEKSFDINGFLDTVPVLITSDTKAVVNATLLILEKIAKKYPEHATHITLLACHAFIHHDNDLQVRSAKLIQAGYTPNNTTLKEELQPYLATIMSSAHKILDGLFEPLTNDNEKLSMLPVEMEPEATKELIPIPAIDNIDDLVFLASQAFDNNQPWHIAVFPAALIHWQKEIQLNNIPKFEPSLQRALKIMKSGTNAQQGRLDVMLAVFFIDVCIHWVRKYPGEAKVLDDLFEKFKQVEGSTVRRWTAINKDMCYLDRFESHYELPIYSPYRQLLLIALEKIRNNDTIPLLCIPTHEPGWIDPFILVERFAAYEKNNIAPYEMDIQAAISRCYLYNTDKAAELAENKLTSEYQNLLLFLFDKNKEPIPPLGYPSAWMTASLTKKKKLKYKAFESLHLYKKPFSYYTGQQQWESVDEEYQSNEYDYKAGKTVTIMRRHKIMRVLEEKEPAAKQNTFKKLISKISSVKEETRPPAIYDYLHLNTQWLSLEHNDIRRILLLTPNHPEPLLADTINQCLKHPTFWSETDKKFVIATLKTLHEIWDEFGNMAHVFIATCLLSSDKTVTNLAAEIWINGVVGNKISSATIGDVISKHESIEFVPLKRITDLITQQLFRISNIHDLALQTLIENTIKQLPEKPITNLKKLLEIYGELLVTNNTTVTDPLILNKLQSWGGTTGIQKIARRLLTNN